MLADIIAWEHASDEVMTSSKPSKIDRISVSSTGTVFYEESLNSRNI